MNLQNQPLKRVIGDKQLGVHMRYARNQANTVGAKRVEQGKTVARRIRWAPLPMHARARLVASLVCPGSLYGIQVAALPGNLLDSLRSVVTNAIWGDTRKLRCKELVLTLLVPGHLTDPMQYAIYHTLKMFRRMLKRRPDLHDLIYAIWHAYQQQRTPQALGPIALVLRALHRLQWTWEEPLFFSRAGRAPLTICGGDDQWWLHQLRDAIRCSEWRIAGERRGDCEGMSCLGGIDRKATTFLLNSGKLCARDLGAMRTIITGSLRTRKRLHDAGLADSPMCEFCGEGEETVEHLFWQCPCWDNIRRQFDDRPSARITDAWPRCTRECGVFVEDDAVIAFQDELIAEEPQLAAILSRPLQPFDANLHSSVVWTDGACSNNQDARFRRGGCGVFHGTGHPLNISCPLPGVSQSNNRAELVAVILALQQHAGPLEIRTDSDHVVQGVRCIRDCGHYAGRENADLWCLLQQLVLTRPNDCLQINWVKGHAKACHVERGITTLEDKEGNDAADALATNGATEHAAPDSLLLDAAWKQTAAKTAQRMMIEILTARWKCAPCIIECEPVLADPG